MRDRESRSMSDMFEERRAKMAILGHGVRESGRGRIANVLARRVVELVWEWGFGAEVFLSVWLCEKMLNKMWPFK